MRSIVLSAGVLVLGLVPCISSALDRDARSRTPLDLPSGGARAVVDDPSGDRALDAIVAFGAETEGDAFFWCFELSAATADDGVIDLIRAELRDALGDLSPTSRFTLVSFADADGVWSALPRPATESWRAGALEWLAARRPAGEACLEPGLLRTLEIAHRSSAGSPRVIVVAIDAVTCAGFDDSTAMVERITAANWGRLPIDTIDLGGAQGGDRIAARVLRAIAQENGGRALQPRW